MPGSLFDTNVWLAAIFPTHPFHTTAQRALQQTTPAQPAVWCRSTQQSFLRLASTPTLHKAYGAERVINHDALLVQHALHALPQVVLREEPPGVSALWCQLSGALQIQTAQGLQRHCADTFCQRHHRAIAVADHIEVLQPQSLLRGAHGRGDFG